MGNDLKQNEQEKLNNNIIKQNANILKKLSTQKAKRHVKEKNEPIFEQIMTDLRNDYGKNVVLNSSEEILKILNE